MKKYKNLDDIIKKDKIYNDKITYIFNKLKSQLWIAVVNLKLSRNDYIRIKDDIEIKEKKWVMENCSQQYIDKLVAKNKFNIGKEHPNEECKPSIIRNNDILLGIERFISEIKDTTTLK